MCLSQGTTFCKACTSLGLSPTSFVHFPGHEIQNVDGWNLISRSARRQIGH